MELIGIKTKVNHSYVYFLVEPTVVFVYRIEEKRYITKLDMDEGNNGEIFKIDQETDFDIFDHQRAQPLEGRGFFVNQEDMNEIIGEINRQIQKSRQTVKLENQTSAVHIVTSESAAGSLRLALNHPKTVIGFPDSFSIGPMWNLNEETGQRLRKKWLFDNINTEQEDGEYENKFANTLREIEDIADYMPIYIWVGNNADEQIGLRFYVYLLREKLNDIYLMNATEHFAKRRAEASVLHTSQMDSDDLRMFFDDYIAHKPLADKRRLRYLKEWEKLAQTKNLLHLWRDGEIKSAPEHHYDSFILKTIEKLHNNQGTKDFIETGIVIGEILEGLDMNIDIYFLEYRIRHLVYNGVLELKGIPKSAWHYSVKLK